MLLALKWKEALMCSHWNKSNKKKMGLKKNTKNLFYSFDAALYARMVTMWTCVQLLNGVDYMIIEWNFRVLQSLTLSHVWGFFEKASFYFDRFCPYCSIKTYGRLSLLTLKNCSTIFMIKHRLFPQLFSEYYKLFRLFIYLVSHL